MTAYEQLRKYFPSNWKAHSLGKIKALIKTCGKANSQIYGASENNNLAWMS